jgi:hypothetical protein
VAARTVLSIQGYESRVRAGRKLGVATVIEGSVGRWNGSGSMQLVSAGDGYELWSESYDRELADVLAVRKDRRSIAAALRLRLGHQRLGPRRTTHCDLDAYDLYLKGGLPGITDGGSLPRHTVFQAGGRHSSFARATLGWPRASSASILRRYPEWHGPRPSPRVKASRWRTPRLIRHWPMGPPYEWDKPGADSRFKRAIAADPNYPTARQW